MTSADEAMLRAGDLIANAARRLRVADVDEARHEALLLLAHAVGLPRTMLLAHPEREIERPAAARYAELVSRRAAREPYAYLVGEREFYGRPFTVNADVLIPRPETETLVEAALEILRVGRSGRGASGDGIARDGRGRGSGRENVAHPLVVDVGTGTGAIALSVAAEAPDAQIVACDVSAKALAVAARNRERLGLATRAQLVRGDLLAWLRRPADLVLANLPYLPSGRLPELMPEVGQYEPHLALFSDADGFGLIRRLLHDARRAVRPGGTLLLELDPEQVALVRAAAPWGQISVLRDLLGNDRVVRVDVP